MQRIMKHKILIGVGTVVLIGAIILLFLYHLQWWTLTIKVTLGENRTLSNVKVKMINERFDVPVISGKTDSDGIVSFSLPEGEYLAKAQYYAFSNLITPYRGQAKVVLKSNSEIHIHILPGAI